MDWYGEIYGLTVSSAAPAARPACIESFTALYVATAIAGCGNCLTACDVEIALRNVVEIKRPQQSGERQAVGHFAGLDIGAKLVDGHPGHEL